MERCSFIELAMITTNNDIVVKLYGSWLRAKCRDTMPFVKPLMSGLTTTKHGWREEFLLLANIFENSKEEIFNTQNGENYKLEHDNH